VLLDDLPDADWLAAGWALRVTRVGIELPAWLRPEPLRGPTLLSPVHFELGTERIHLRRLTAALPGSEEMAALAEALQPLGLVLEPLQHGACSMARRLASCMPYRCRPWKGAASAH